MNYASFKLHLIRIHKISRHKHVWIRNVKEVGDVERGKKAKGIGLKNTDRPALGRESAVPDSDHDVALCMVL